jgi:rhodanese-related sulfurtransferase
MNTVTRGEIRDFLEKQASIVLVEALPENFYQAGHLPGAIAIPAGYVADLAPRFIPDKKTPIIVYCTGRICGNSAQAVEEFKSLGYADVRHYPGGKEDWTAAGLPLETTPSAELYGS